MGAPGLRFGSRAFPPTSAVLLSILSEEALAQLMKGIDEFCATCGEKLEMISWDVDVLR